MVGKLTERGDDFGDPRAGRFLVFLGEKGFGTSASSLVNDKRRAVDPAIAVGTSTARASTSCTQALTPQASKNCPETWMAVAFGTRWVTWRRQSVQHLPPSM